MLMLTDKYAIHSTPCGKHAILEVYHAIEGGNYDSRACSNIGYITK